MIRAITNARILTPDGFKNGQSVLFKKGIILEVCDDQLRQGDVMVERDLDGMTLLPGFIDVQVNGGGGVLLNDDPTIDGIKTIGRAHRKFGTTGFFPTLISEDLDVMEKAIRAVGIAIEQDVPGVLGIHLEGPFLNEEKRGVHDSAKFMQIGSDELELLSSLKGGKTIVTLAPEKTTPSIIRELQARGIIISAGHTQASYETTLLAMDAGLTGFTHLFNAMISMQSRDPGIIAAALQDPRAWCGIIVDGHHVHPAMLKLALRAKVKDQIFLVTDAMPSVGAKHKSFSLGGADIKVEDGKCVTSKNTLAGSDLDMMSAIRNTVNILDIDLEQAVRMASVLPARFVGMQGQIGEIRAGHQANFVSISPEKEVIDTWFKGEQNFIS